MSGVMTSGRSETGRSETGRSGDAGSPSTAPGTGVITLDTQDPTPPFEQIRRRVAALAQSGMIEPGTRLPTVRQLAGDLRVAPGTVARAYKELEAAGIVVTRRGAGTRIAPGPSRGSASHGAPLTELASSFVSAARQRGADDAAVRSAIEAALLLHGAQGAIAAE